MTTLGGLKAERPEAPFGSARAEGQYRSHFIILCSIATALLIHALAVLAVRWNTPVIGMHAFRQTETAISSYWLLKGSPWLAYETPVLGAPWSIPYECPLYQLLVAALVRLTGMPLDPAGRLISFVFVLLMIHPVRKLALAYGRADTDMLVFTILLLASPVYLYWGTSFLIETFALFFSLAFLAESERSARTMNRAAIVASFVYGTIGALVKITTFVTCWSLALVMFVHHLTARWHSRRPLRPQLFTAAAILTPAPAVFWIWNRFADAHKAKNPIAASVNSTMISSTVQGHLWNLGTWGQLFSKQLVDAVGSACNDSLGGVAVLVAAGLLVIWYYAEFDRQTVTLAGIAIAAFLLPFFLFTNLFIHHNYYFTENAIFPVFAVTLVIGRLCSTGKWPAAWALLFIVVISQLLRFYGFFARDIANPYYREMLPVAQSVKANTDPESVVVIYGQEWSPVIPYYSQRRALMEPEWIPLPEVIAGLNGVLKPIDGHPVEAIVRCRSPRDSDAEYAKFFTTLDANFRKQHIGGCDIYFTRLAASSP